MSKGQVITKSNNTAAIRRAVTGEMLMKAALAGGFVIEAYAKLKASRGRPGLNVDTGNLVNSINTTPGEQSHTRAEAQVGTGVIYAATHEFGYPPRNIPARPFMRPAIDEHQREIEQAVKIHVKAQIEQAAK
jgi:phage gpG-like protein